MFWLTDAPLSWLLLALGTVLFLYLNKPMARGLPPSPGLWLPVVGHLYLMEKNPRQQYLSWHKRLGPVVSIYLGNRLAIMLFGYDTIQEAFVKQKNIFSERPDTYVTRQLSRDKGFVACGHQWKVQKKASLEILRRLGAQSGGLEEIIQVGISHFIDEVTQLKGQAFDPRPLLMTSVSNVVTAIAFGREFRHDDAETAECARVLGEEIVHHDGMAALNFLPCLRYLPWDLFGLQKVKRLSERLEENLVRKQIQLCDDNHSFVSEYKKKMDPNKNTEICEENLVGVVNNLFAAGTETVTTTLCWSLLYLLHNPACLERCCEEVRGHLGLQRRVEFKDRKTLLFTAATVMEVQRIACISPLSIFHTASSDTEFRGWKIPKGCIILPNLDSVMLSEDVWQDPHQFRPERFLQEGKLIKKDEFIPFSIGSRSCLGENIATMELFLFITTILQKFNIVAKDAHHLPPLEGRFGLSCSPFPYEIILEPIAELC
ncbi:cytochrome P450 2U1-like [Physella acuta]|uniref:cytochrome P450 2U1-like n=1 Tax=Physella acuta TaxID=109671 RepID=UPI0027DC7900|nr:cytochrome P450 2U1-like [Physella acuta]